MAHPHVDLAALVISDGAERPVIARTRTDGALTMQVLTMGVWHRRTPDLSHTACGVPIQTQFSPLRREELSDPLCPECFTTYEHQRAAARAARERDLDR